MDYPPEKREIVIASDGSNDATPAIVRRFADQGVRLLDYAVRRGKARVLNTALTEVRGDIVLFSDANTNYDATAARLLARWFRDPSVGVVCGRLILTDPQTGSNVDSLYWKFETFLKQREGRLGALLGVNGAIYAMRRELYTPIPDGTLIDDFIIPLMAKLRSGCAVVYDKDAIAREETPPDIGSEFRRRSRIGAGGFQSLPVLWRLFNPLRGWIAFTFFSHKVMRWLCPFLLLGLLAANAVLWSFLLYRIFFIGQVAFYGVSFATALAPFRVKPPKLLRLGTMFTCMNLALLVGFSRWLWGSAHLGVWQRTVRPAEVQQT
jgi:cellulose synthase/poly-beta-1,6-N-acetylglucosamine synthase-like glycosyltransferase